MTKKIKICAWSLLGSVIVLIIFYLVFPVYADNRYPYRYYSGASGAAAEGNVFMLKLMLTLGYFIPSGTTDGASLSPLEAAITFDRSSAVKFLLDEGAGQEGLLDICIYNNCSADTLDAIIAASSDLLTTSVVLYAISSDINSGLWDRLVEYSPFRQLFRSIPPEKLLVYSALSYAYQNEYGSDRVIALLREYPDGGQCSEDEILVAINEMFCGGSLVVPLPDKGMVNRFQVSLHNLGLFHGVSLADFYNLVIDAAKPL